MPYSSYDHDKLEAADTMRIERKIYFEAENADISPLTALTVEQLQAMREESAAAEQAVFENLQTQAAAWEEQAGKTLFLDKALEYVRTRPVEHTSNQWKTPDEYRHIRSNTVYQMSYSISENTRYDRAAQKSVPYSWSLTWSVRTNSPDGYRQAKIAGQDRKVFADKAAMEKYLNGRIKAYQHLFTELSPPIPQEYAQHFKVNGQLLPGYTIEGEPPQQTAEISHQTDEAGKDMPEPPLSAASPERSERMSEVFSIQIHNRKLFEQGGQGVWVELPTTADKLREAMKQIGISTDNQQDFFINGYSYPEDRRLALPYDMVLAADVDELNYLAARLEPLAPAEIAELNAAAQNPRGGFESIGQIIDYPDNVDFYVHIPEVATPAQLGVYYLHRSGMVQMPEEWKAGIDPARFGQHVAQQEQGAFTPYGYLVKSGDEWQRVHEGQPVPEEYRLMGFPPPEAERDEGRATAAPAAVEPPPVVPIVLNSTNSAERMKEITDKLETGIQALFESEKYKAYLTTMSKFHSYSFNNTLLIAMQGGSLVAGFNKWRDEFERHVKKGAVGIKILAPAPFKTKKQQRKLDPTTGQPVIGKDGKAVTEEVEVTIPAFKVVSVFDVSQTEGKELPLLAAKELTGDVEQYRDFFTALEKTSPVPIAFEKIESSAHGYYHLEDRRIAIDEGMSELQTLKTAIHEIAHAKLHAIDKDAPATEQADRPDQRTREVQAESVAYAICQHYGLDTSDYSFGYVAGWSSGRDLKELKASLETIRATANDMINEIDGHLAELQQQREAAQQHPAMENADPEQPTYTIYQLKRGEELRDYRFEPYDRLQAAGLSVIPENYEQVYSAPLAADTTLENIYEKFNIDHPADFRGHSLSVSDIVVLHQDGKDTAHYCDSFGFQEVPEFLKQQDKQLTPDALLTGESIQTPRGSFHVTAMSREQMEAAGYGFHHHSEDGKYLIMGNGTQAFAVPVQQESPIKAAELTQEQNTDMIDGVLNNMPTASEKEAKEKAGEKPAQRKARREKEKPSIREMLKAGKEAREPKKAAPEKSQELEV